MKALLYSCDRHHPVAEFVIKTYERHWPSHPFIFKIPYTQSRPDYLDQYPVELVQVNENVKSKMRGLLDGITDDEWVYWCMDDKYLTACDEGAVSQVYQSIVQNDDPLLAGVMLTRNRDINRFINKGDKKNIGKYNFYAKTRHSCFWQHAFYRAGMLKEVLVDNGYPEDYVFYGGAPYERKIRNRIVEGMPRVYVPHNNFLGLAESTWKGKLTKNCAEELEKYELPFPAGFDRLSYSPVVFDPVDTWWRRFIVIVKRRLRVLNDLIT